MPETKQSPEGSSGYPAGRCCTLEAGSLTLGGTEILHGINLYFSPEEIVLINGHNGAGKTSLLRILGGELPLSDGSLTWGDNRPKTVFIPDTPWVYDVLTVREHLDFFAKMWGKKPDIDAILHEHRLNEHHDVYGANLSLGLKQRLLFALACLGDPGMILLDEPFNGLDGKATAELACRIKNLAANGCCIVIASHHHEAIKNLFTREITLTHGHATSDNSISKANATPKISPGIQN